MKSPKQIIDNYIKKTINESKFIQDMDLKHGVLKKELGMSEDEKLTLSKIEQELNKVHKKYKDDEKMNAKDLKFVERLNAAKTLMKLHK